MGSQQKKAKRQSLNDWSHEIEVEVTSSEVRLTLYSGDVIAIDRTERHPSTIMLHGYPCCLEVLPRAENALLVRPRSEPSLRKNKLACRQKKQAPPSKSE